MSGTEERLWPEWAVTCSFKKLGLEVQETWGIYFWICYIIEILHFLASFSVELEAYHMKAKKTKCEK